MANELTPTQLRANLFQILDEILETGQPREITRGGRKLVIMPAGGKKLDLDALPKRNSLADCTYDQLADLSWDYEPDPELFPQSLK